MPHTSPFPGMDPWLEDYWGDVYASLTAYTRDRLQPYLPSGLRAQIEEYVVIEARHDDRVWQQRYVPDLSISSKLPRDVEASAATSTLTEVEPVRLTRLVELPTLRRVQILDSKSGNRLVTSIEFLSPANKLGRGLEQFCKKQRDLLDAGVNVVEIDLVRAGDWASSIDPGLVPPQLRTLYRALVVSASQPEDCEYYPIPLDAPLPKIKIPLRPTDKEIVLELQPLMDQAYINGRYADEIDYTRSPGVPLPEPMASWAHGWLKQQAKL